METALTIIIPSVIACIIFIIAQGRAKKTEKKMDANDLIIRRPKINLILYIIVTTLFLLIFFIFCVPAAFNKDNSEGIYAVYVFLPILFPCFFVIFMWFRWRIIIKGNQITSRSYFGKEKSYTFDHITKVNRLFLNVNGEDLDCMCAYHDKKVLFSITAECPGFHILASRLESEGVPINTGKAPNNKKDSAVMPGDKQFL
jgi:hypothetical protein